MKSQAAPNPPLPHALAGPPLRSRGDRNLSPVADARPTPPRASQVRRVSPLLPCSPAHLLTWACGLCRRLPFYRRRRQRRRRRRRLRSNLLALCNSPFHLRFRQRIGYSCTRKTEAWHFSTQPWSSLLRKCRRDSCVQSRAIRRSTRAFRKTHTPRSRPLTPTQHAHLRPVRPAPLASCASARLSCRRCSAAEILHSRLPPSLPSQPGSAPALQGHERVYVPSPTTEARRRTDRPIGQVF